MEEKIQGFSNLEIKRRKEDEGTGEKSLTENEIMEIRGFGWVAEKPVHACSCREVACICIAALKLREIINTQRKKKKNKWQANMMSFKPALSFHTPLRQAAGPQQPLLIRFLGAHFLMLNSEVRRRSWYLVSMATSGNSRQIYNWNATQGLGWAPALSWLPYIQNGDPSTQRTQPRPGGANLHRYISIRISGRTLPAQPPTRPV